MPSFRHRTALLLLSLLLACPGALAADATPRSQVAGVAQAIEDHYFDADRGRDIAQGLRSAADAGAFDAQSSPQALAEALTARLKPLDRHFRVHVLREGERKTLAQRGPPPDAAPDSGIARVEVLAGDIGLLGLRGFADFEFGRDDQPARQAIDAALQKLAHADAVVVDLRGNRGGSPAMVGYLASAFVARGADIFNTFHSRAGTFSEAPADWYRAPRTTVPLYVVIDARTGSAAESFAYTLQQAGRATIVGETSGGAANPGAPIATREGLAVFVPTGSPLNPFSGGNWEGTGVQPDVRAPSAEAFDVALRLARAAVTQGKPE
jgi:C-terminal processing protease CtpA/Prc